jgi:hypothetical protein
MRLPVRLPTVDEIVDRVVEERKVRHRG